MATCPNCQNNLSEGATFCGACGTKINAAPVANTAPVAPQPAPVAAPSFDLKKIFKIAIPVVAVVLVLVIALSLFSSTVNDNVIYSKNGVIYVTGAVEPYRLGAYSDISFSADGEKIFFTDNGSLYWVAVGEDEEKVKISSDVSEYLVNEDADVVVYQKNDSIYLYDFDESEKVAKGEMLQITADGSFVFYSNDKGTYAKKGADGDEYKICDENDRISFANDDMTEFYYLEVPETANADSNSYESSEEKEVSKGYTLFKYTIGDEAAEEVASNVTDVLGLYDDGMYYVTAGAEKTIEYGNYGYSRSYEVSKLCWNDGEETVVSENYTSSVEVSNEAPVIVFKTVDYDSVGKVADYDELEQKLEEATTYNVVEKDGTPAVIDLDNIEDIEFSENGDVLYAFADYTGEEVKEGIIYEIGISDGSSEKLYEGVVSLVGYYDGDYVYYKKNSDEEKELYINDELVATDVYEFLGYNEESGDFFYAMDKSSNGYALYVTTGGEGEKVADDVADFEINYNNGDVYYIKDASLFGGDLYLYGEDEAIDSSVSNIRIPKTWSWEK